MPGPRSLTSMTAASLRTLSGMTKLICTAEPAFGVANGIADHVFDGPVKQFAPAIDNAIAFGIELDRGIALPGFVFGIGKHFLEQTLERHRLKSLRTFNSLHGRKRQQLADELIKAFGFALNAVEVRSHGGIGIFAGKLQRDAQARQRGAKFMRDIAQQQPLGVHQGFQALRHMVEVVHQGMKFIAAKDPRLRRRRLFHARAQLALREFARGFSQADHRPGENQDQDKGGQAADGNSHRQLWKGEVKKIAIPVYAAPDCGED